METWTIRSCRLDVPKVGFTTEMRGDLLAISLPGPEQDDPLTRFADQEPMEPSSAMMAVGQLLLELLGRLCNALAGPILDFEVIVTTGCSFEKKGFPIAATAWIETDPSPISQRQSDSNFSMSRSFVGRK